MKKKVMLMLSFLLLSIGLVLAQTRATGIVIDNKNEPVAGATVAIKGTTNATVTDHEGKFSLAVSEGSIISIRLMGMKTLELPATTDMRVLMEDDEKMLDEVIVRGYGVTRKSAFTGAAGSIKSSDIVSSTDANVIKSLDGKIAGLQLNLSSGQPGAPTEIFIRGQNSINSGTQPLYVVDGIPINSDIMGSRKDEGSEISPLSALNAVEIETITVLKDATATSIYGARASNGVIVITTKRGAMGKTSVNFTARMGYELRPKRKSNYKMLNTAKYKELTLEALANEYEMNGADGDVAYYNTALGWNEPYTSDGFGNIMNKFATDILGMYITEETDVDWYKEITRSGFVQEYNVDIRGGGTTSTAPQYFLAVGYTSNESFMKSKDLDRYSVRLNIDQSPSKRIKLGINTSLSYTKINMGTGGGYFSDPLTQAYMQVPNTPVKMENGGWNMNTITAYNPVAQRSKLGDQSLAKQYKVLVSPYVQVTLPENLVFQSKAGFDFYFLDEFGYWSFLQPGGANVRGMGENTNSHRVYTTWTNTLNYLNTFKENHNINILLGQEIQQTKYKTAYLAGNNYPVDYLNEVSLASVPSSAATTQNEVALASFFFNGEYDYKNKYYLSGSFRYDGSSRFGSNNRWAPFWSIGAKYRLLEEEVIKEATKDWLHNLTLRTSYGTTGNQEVGSQDLGNALYASRNLFDFGYNYNGLPGSSYLQFGNPDLKWEQTRKFNVGIDLNILKRINLEVDYYNHTTADMVFDVPVSFLTGLGKYSKNIGELSNKGIEISLNVDIMRTKDLTWKVGIAAAKNKNKVKKLSTDKPIETDTQTTEVGRPLNTFKMREWAGVNPDDGEPMWYLNETGSETTNKYNLAKKRYVGDANPDWLGSFSTSVEWKGLDLNVQFNYSVGRKIYGSNLRYDEQIGNGALNNFTNYVYDNRWQKPGDNAKVPRLVFNEGRNANAHSSRFMMNGDYLKLRSLTIGYTLPKTMLKKAQIENARIFVNADNLYTFTKKDYRGFDPSGVGSDGVQWWNYPQPCTVLFGLTLGF